MVRGPHFLVRLRSHTVYENTSVKLFCTVDGFPLPIVKWLVIIVNSVIGSSLSYTHADWMDEFPRRAELLLCCVLGTRTMWRSTCLLGGTWLMWRAEFILSRFQGQQVKMMQNVLFHIISFTFGDSQCQAFFYCLKRCLKDLMATKVFMNIKGHCSHLRVSYVANVYNFGFMNDAMRDGCSSICI